MQVGKFEDIKISKVMNWYITKFRFFFPLCAERSWFIPQGIEQDFLKNSARVWGYQF